MTPQEHKWVETNNSLCAVLRQVHDVLALSPLPPKRQWVGLTDEDKKKIATAAGCTEDDDGHIVTEIFRLAEAKLKERNT